jgi:O-antigen ligase
MLSKYIPKALLTKENLFLFSFFLIIFTMPISPNLNSICIIILAIIWILSGSFLNYKNFCNVNFISHAVLYAMFIVGVFYSEDKKNAFFQLEQKFSLLAFPIIFSTMPKLKQKHYNYILYGFVVSTLIYTCYCLCAAFYFNYIVDSSFSIKENYFTNQTLAGYIGFHSTYFSIYIIISLVIIFDFLLKNKLSTLNYILTLTISAFFIFFIFLLASRIIMLSLIVLLLVLLIKFLVSKKMNFIQSLFIAVSCIIGVLFFLKSDYLKNRTNEILNVNTLDLIGSNNENGVSQRVFFWQNALEIIKGSPYIGYGTGDVYLQYDKQYDKLLAQNPHYPPSVIAAIIFFKEKNYNTHSQYLQVLISFGSVGLFVFLAYLFNLFINSIRTKNIIYLSFLLLFVLVFFTESVFERHYGIVFFMFFNSIFLFHSPNYEVKTRHNLGLST